jgi:hypothetical protein
MKEILAFTMVFPFLLFFIITPILNDLETQRGKVVSTVIHRATERAALEGRYTYENTEEIYETLESIGYTRDDIELEVTTDITFRGDYVTGKISAPNDYFFILGSLIMPDDESEELRHVRSASRMSEFIN